MIDIRGIEQMLSELRATSALAQGRGLSSDKSAVAGGPDFAQALTAAIDKTNQVQNEAHKMAEDFSTGNTSVNIQDVMINLQKANLSFQEMVQVRNKLVSAYHDVINMQV